MIASQSLSPFLPLVNLSAARGGACGPCSPQQPPGRQTVSTLLTSVTQGFPFPSTPQSRSVQQPLPLYPPLQPTDGTATLADAFIRQITNHLGHRDPRVRFNSLSLLPNVSRLPTDPPPPCPVRRCRRCRQRRRRHAKQAHHRDRRPCTPACAADPELGRRIGCLR